VYGYPLKDACRIAADTTLAFLEKEDGIDDVCFVLFSRGDYDVYQDYLRQLR
jgi:O-acetyl-ADP-ribose deacetylase (regulator of RNase III)